jgi:ABC-type lipoprotein export system ATPase subunit
MALLTVENISRTEGDFVLTGISFTQKKHQKIAIAGETGSGKSTLLKIIAGLQQADTGEVYLGKERVEGAYERLVPGHPRIAYLSQNFELPKFLRVEQVLNYANTLSEEAASTLYNVCQIDHLQKRRTDELSGGEKQRIAIARLLITSP